MMRPTGTDKARIEVLIVTEAKRGTGTRDDLSRIVREYWTLDGMKVAEYDPTTDDFTAELADA